MKIYQIPAFVALIFLPATPQAAAQPTLYTQGANNRLAAEWEPALGVMLTWPLCVPYKLAVEMAKDSHLYTLVKNDSARAEAVKWFRKWGMKASGYSFVYTPQDVDAWWVRDWGPGAVFTPQGEMKLADPKYIYSTPVTNIPCEDSLFFLYTTKDKQILKTETDDNATVPLGKGLKTGVLDLPYISTGGNVLTDGVGGAFSTCVLINENQFYGVNPDQFYDLNRRMLGLGAYHVISNFEKRGIQHIDCLLKILDEERILVMEPPADHELYQIYQDIVEKELSKLRTVYGRPYEILRIKTSRYRGNRLAAYSNSIIVNKNIYVPLFQISEDSVALGRWREAMPGYTVKGFEYLLADEPLVDAKVREHYVRYGWADGDAAHCRTRAVWDAEMLFMTTRKIEKEVAAKKANTVYATIIDYSKKGLLPGKTEVMWRIAGADSWQHSKMKTVDQENHFSGEIPAQKPGVKIEYFVSAVSKSGKKETQPRTAPKGYFQYFTK